MVKITRTKNAEFAWMNGRFVKWNNCKIHIMTHALHYGGAVFEGMRSYKTPKGPSIFRINEHIDRLFYSAEVLGIKIKFSKNEVKNAIRDLILKNRMEESYIRPLAYFGYGGIGVYPKNVRCDLAILAFSDYARDLLPIRIMTSKYSRPFIKSTVSGTKISGNYASSILAMHEARTNGYDEALMLDYKGFVSEGPAENLFAVKKGNLITPASKSALAGITRDTIIKLSADLGIKCRKKNLRISEIKNADELFFCGTGKEISPIISLDDKKIGNGKSGKITLQLRDKYFDVVKGKDKKYSKWLCYVK